MTTLANPLLYLPTVDFSKGINRMDVSWPNLEDALRTDPLTRSTVSSLMSSQADLMTRYAGIMGGFAQSRVNGTAFGGGSEASQLVVQAGLFTMATAWMSGPAAPAQWWAGAMTIASAPWVEAAAAGQRGALKR